MENDFPPLEQFKDMDSEVRWMLEQGSIKNVIEPAARLTCARRGE